MRPPPHLVVKSRKTKLYCFELFSHLLCCQCQKARFADDVFVYFFENSLFVPRRFHPSREVCFFFLSPLQSKKSTLNYNCTSARNGSAAH